MRKYLVSGMSVDSDVDGSLHVLIQEDAVYPARHWGHAVGRKVVGRLRHLGGEVQVRITDPRDKKIFVTSNSFLTLT